MPSRKTENRIPEGLQAADLGQAVVAPDGHCALLSFVTAPLVIHRENVYVVFITDAALAGTAASYEWTFTEAAGAPVVNTTSFGEAAYTPQQPGTLQVAVRILDGADTEQAALSLTQEATSASEELEVLISSATEQPGPAIASPDVLRELINEHNLYYQNVAPETPEGGDGYKRFVFNMAYDGTARRNAAERKQHLDQLALALNTATLDFATLSAEGAGVCGIRPVLLAMTLPGMLGWTLLPEDANRRAVAAEQLRKSLGALEENKRVDLYNIMRFPKSNITWCGRILETLRDQYFNGTGFDDILTGMSGVRAQWMIAQYQQGPVVRS